MNKPTININALLFAIISAVLLPSVNYASGFQITQQSGPSLLRSIGGAGLSGDDLGDLFYNPASLWLYEEGSIQLGLTSISTDVQLSDTGSFQSVQGNSLPVQGTSGRLNDTAIVPRIYATFKKDNSSNYQYAIYVTPTFGQETNYESNWFGRYHALESDLEVSDYGLIVGRKAGDRSYFSISPILQRLDTRLTRALQFSPQLPDGSVILNGSSNELGYAIGWSTSSQIADGDTASRFGVSFRSKTSHKIEGTTTINTPLGPQNVDSTADLVLPETVFINYLQPVGSNKQHSIGITARWTNWSRNDEIVIESAGLPNDVTPQNWNDSWMIGVGGTIKLSNQWNLLLGVGFDESPIQDPSGRSARNPDSDTTWFSLGAQYLHNKKHRWSFGIVLWDFDDANVQSQAGLGFPAFGGDILNGSAQYGTNTGIVLEYQRLFK